jgi:NADPH:quinone reductase-like Zn-dependent oxidoreductase
MFLVMPRVIFCTMVGSEEKLVACKVLGADVCINYRTEDFVERIKQETNGKGITSHLIIFGLLHCT